MPSALLLLFCASLRARAEPAVDAEERARELREAREALREAPPGPAPAGAQEAHEKIATLLAFANRVDPPALLRRRDPHLMMSGIYHSMYPPFFLAKIITLLELQKLSDILLIF